MKENKLINFLIPIIAIIVVFESVMLVSNLEKNPRKNTLVETNKVENLVLKKEETQEAAADFIWETEKLDMEVGETYKVALNLSSKKDLVLDSVETYFYFDPKLVTISKLVTNKKVGEELKPTKIDNKNGIVSVVLWGGEEQGVGFNTKKGETTEIFTFEVKPLTEGNFDFNLSTSTIDKKFATIIVETNTSKSLAYSSNKLEINVTK